MYHTDTVHLLTRHYQPVPSKGYLHPLTDTSWLLFCISIISVIAALHYAFNFLVGKRDLTDLDCQTIPAIDWSCCFNNNDCYIADADCDVASECAGSLACGVDNCYQPGTNTGGDATADCCFDPDNPCTPEIAPQRIFHVGLANPNLETCDNSDCDGKLFWENGENFKCTSQFGSDILASGKECFVYDGIQDLVLNVACCHHAYFF